MSRLITVSSLQHYLGDTVVLFQFWSWFGSRLKNLNIDSAEHVNISQSSVKVISDCGLACILTGAMECIPPPLSCPFSSF